MLKLYGLSCKSKSRTLLQINHLLRWSTESRHLANSTSYAPLPQHIPAAQTDVPTPLSHHPAIDLTFNDSKEAYKSKSTKEILRALLVFNLCSVDFIVDKNKELITLTKKVLGKTLFHKLMKATFYGHFVAGESQETIKPLIRKNRSCGVKAILDYSAESDLSEEQAKDKIKQAEVVYDTPVSTENPPMATELKFQSHDKFAKRSNKVESAKTYYYEGEKQCDENMEIFINCINAVADSTRKEGMAAIKLTALGRPQLLLQISDVLAQAHTFYDLLCSSNKDTPNLIDKTYFKERLDQMGIDLDYNIQKKWLTILNKNERGSVDLLAWENLMQAQQDLGKIFNIRNTMLQSIRKTKKSDTGEMEQIVPALSEEGMAEIRNMLHRTDAIVKHATQTGVRVMIDAEQSYFQPAIRRITLELMRKYNKERNVVFNTYQCYLKAAKEQIMIDLNLAETEDFYFGAKLVRGAYMDQERSRAQSLGYEDPINPNYEATSDMYDSVVDEVFSAITRREKGRIAVMMATHNEETVRKTIEKMKKYNVMPSDRLICFGQLLGMCDQISFPLGQAGYSVYKYVPYGPVDEVIPYLSRRATENRGVVKKVKKEKNLLRQELWRRIKQGEVFLS